MPLDRARKALAHRFGEITVQLVGQIRIFWHVGVDEMPAEPDLAVCERYSELRPREAHTTLAPLGKLIIARQELDGAIQLARALEAADEMLELRQSRSGLQ